MLLQNAGRDLRAEAAGAVQQQRAFAGDRVQRALQQAVMDQACAGDVPVQILAPAPHIDDGRAARHQPRCFRHAHHRQRIERAFHLLRREAAGQVIHADAAKLPRQFRQGIFHRDQVGRARIIDDPAGIRAEAIGRGDVDRAGHMRLVVLIGAARIDHHALAHGVFQDEAFQRDRRGQIAQQRRAFAVDALHTGEIARRLRLAAQQPRAEGRLVAELEGRVEQLLVAQRAGGDRAQCLAARAAGAVAGQDEQVIREALQPLNGVKLIARADLLAAGHPGGCLQQVRAADITGEQAVSRENAHRLVSGARVGEQDAQVLRRVAGRVQRLQANAAQPPLRAIHQQRTAGGGGIGVLPVRAAHPAQEAVRSGGRGQLARTADEIGMDVRLGHLGDAQPFAGRSFKVGGDVARRIDDQCFARRLAAQHIGGLGQRRIVEVPEQHSDSSICTAQYSAAAPGRGGPLAPSGGCAHAGFGRMLHALCAAGLRLPRTT